MRPFEGLLEKPGVVFALAAVNAAMSAMLIYIAHLYYTTHQIGTSVFAGCGALLTGYFAWHYFTDARSLSRRPKKSTGR